jgi:hypothetical protein
MFMDNEPDTISSSSIAPSRRLHSNAASSHSHGSSLGHEWFEQFKIGRQPFETSIVLAFFILY